MRGQAVAGGDAEKEGDEDEEYYEEEGEGGEEEYYYEEEGEEGEGGDEDYYYEEEDLLETGAEVRRGTTRLGSRSAPQGSEGARQARDKGTVELEA